MHIPDGFLNVPTGVTTAVAAAAGLGAALRAVRRTLPPRRVPLIGLAAAFIFAAQMLNVPVAGGTSGHLLGATLAAVLLGPAAAVVAMSAVVLLQALMFADGGLTALGANVLNMAVVAPVSGYVVYRAARRLRSDGLRGTLAATAFASWCSIVATAVACAGELASSGLAVWRVVFPAMVGVHMLIGVGEAIVTTLVVAGVARARPELLLERQDPAFQPGYGELALGGSIVAFALAVFVAPHASPLPDGLERVAERLGFLGRARVSGAAPFPDYAVPDLASPVASTLTAGAVGTALAFLLAWMLARLLTPAGPRPPAADATRTD
jgi:cobalt/nickel transport system permease protein